MQSDSEERIEVFELLKEGYRIYFDVKGEPSLWPNNRKIRKVKSKRISLKTFYYLRDKGFITTIGTYTPKFVITDFARQLK